MALNGDRDIDDESGEAEGITPAQAYLGGFYERALAFPGVYIKDIQGWGTTEYDSLKFKTVLNKAFARGTSVVYPGEVNSFLIAGLIIPNITPVQGKPDKEHPDVQIGTWTREEIASQKRKRNLN